MTAKHVVPAITVSDSTKIPAQEITIYRPRSKTQLEISAMERKDSKKAKRTQSLKKPRIGGPNKNPVQNKQSVTKSRRNSDTDRNDVIEISVTPADADNASSSPTTPQRRISNHSAPPSPKKSPSHQSKIPVVVEESSQTGANESTIAVHSEDEEFMLLVQLENEIAKKLKKGNKKGNKKQDQNQPEPQQVLQSADQSLLCVPGKTTQPQRLEKSSQDFAASDEEDAKIVVEEVKVDLPEISVNPDSNDDSGVSKSQSMFSFFTTKPKTNKYTEREENLLRDAIAAFVYMTKKDDPIRKRWRRWKYKDEEYEPESVYDDDYEPDWMKTDQQGWAIGRRIYDKSEMEPEYNPRDKHSNLTNTARKIDLKNAAEIFGLWDNVYGKDAIKALEQAQRWDPSRKDKDTKKTSVKKVSETSVTEGDIDLSENAEDDPVIRKLSDDELCTLIKETNFNIVAIRNWHKAFYSECPGGQLTKDHMHRLLQNLFPIGDTLPFCDAIFRIFGSRYNSEHLDFHEFLNAMNVTTIRSEEEKLRWAFRLYDVDNSGSLNMQEMGAVIRMLEDIEGPKPVPEETTKTLISEEERLENLFKDLDIDNNGLVTLNEFVDGYMRIKAKYEAGKNSSSFVVSVSISDKKRQKKPKEKEKEKEKISIKTFRERLRDGF